MVKPEQPHADKCGDCPVAHPPPGMEAGVLHELGPRLGEHLILQRYGKGEQVIAQGDPVRGWWILRWGHALVYLTDEDGREHIVRLAVPGSILGTCGLGPSPAYCYGVRAMSAATEVCFMPLDSYERLRDRHPDMARLLTAHLAGDIASTYHRLHTIATRTTRGRLADLLLELMAGERVHPRRSEDGNVLLSVARAHLAQMIGVSTETCVRVLGQFKDEGLVTSRGRTIEIIDPEALRAVLSE